MEEIAKYAAVIEAPLLAAAVLTRSIDLLPALALPLMFLAMLAVVTDKKPRVEISAELSSGSLKVEEPLEVEVRARSNTPGILFFKVEDKRLYAERPMAKAAYLGKGSASLGFIAAMPSKRKPSPIEWAFYPITLSGYVKGEAELPQLEIRPYLVEAPRRVSATSIGAPRAPGPLAGPHSLEFLEVREYRPGDPFKLVNWKAYARNPSTLYVNEKLREGYSSTYIILDASSSCRPDAVGHGASLALSIAYSYIRAGYPVGLFVVPEGKIYLPPSDSPAGLRAIREALTMLDVSPPRRRPLPPKADRYIYITCNASADYIARLCERSKRVVAVVVKPLRGPYARLEALLMRERPKALYCATIVTWRPPARPPSEALAYI
ncbi:MAG: DUF58 domain-containing protein [Thermoproteus sp. AZ2]|uniref:DUF58 domain-containing protein n=1 Tax=Thermoproteus sp. AZ2 TaxID=1609232 RepID=A0ACC6V2H5_9CREN|nr:MAG: hypothetical protein TU35_08505 [Thermoproteus sp. AZ2]